ncbi:MAG: SIMPL domain-containing protein [Rickettsiales bacterium]|nr:SIMPL domain-containing protein [Rickettsiales bacterium]
MPIEILMPAFYRSPKGIIMRLFLPLLISLILTAHTAGAQQVGSPVHFITVRGEAVLRAVPDKADLRITLYREGKMASEAKAEVNRLLETLREIVSDFKIEEKDVRTQSTSIQPKNEYNSITSNYKLEGYIAQHTIVLTVRDLERIDDMTQMLVKRGIDRIDAIDYGLAQEQSLKEDTLVKAVEAAQKKAVRLAKAAGREAVEVLAIQEEGVTIPSPLPNMVTYTESPSTNSGSVAAPPAGEVEIRASVTVSYSLK